MRLYYNRLMELNFASTYKDMLASDARDAIELLSLNNVASI